MNKTIIAMTAALGMSFSSTASASLNNSPNLSLYRDIAFYDLEWKLNRLGIEEEEREHIISTRMGSRLEEEPARKLEHILASPENKLSEIIDAARNLDPENWQFYAAIACMESSAGLNSGETRFCHGIFQIHTNTFLDIVNKDDEYRKKLKARFDSDGKIDGIGDKYMKRLYAVFVRDATADEQVELASKLIMPILNKVRREYGNLGLEDQYMIAAAIYNGGYGLIDRAAKRAKKDGEIKSWRDIERYAASYDVMDKAYPDFGVMRIKGKRKVLRDKREELLRRKSVIMRYYARSVPRIVRIIGQSRMPRYARSD